MKKIYIPIAALNVILLVVLVNTAYGVMDVSYKDIILLFIETTVIFEFTNYILNKSKKFFLILLFVVIILAAIVLIYKYSYFVLLFNNMANMAIKINNLISADSTVEFSLIRPFYFLTIPVATYIYLILLKLNKGMVVILINTFILLLFDLLKFNASVKASLFLYVFLIFVDFSICKFVKKVSKNYNWRIIICFLVLSVVLSGIIFRFAPVRYGKEADVIESKFNNLINNEGADIYDFSSIGINTGSMSFLGKKIRMNNTKLSLISGDVPEYLRTKVYYSYNDNRWTENVQLPSIVGKSLLDVQNLVNYNVPNIIDDNELVKRNIRYNRENHTKIKTISVQHLNNNFLNVMISPDFITKVVSRNNSYITMYNNEDYLVGENQSNYTINFYDYSNTETFDKYLKSKYKNDINNIHENANTNNVNYGLLNNALSFTSSNRVKELAYRITSKASNNAEKIKLIQNYLLNNYSYDLQPDAMNNNSMDYADFFLFDEKRGYCTSFATAAVLLCRAVGIPARYVEGFKVGGETDSNGRYVLRSSDAHAWCEVLTSVDKGTWSILETTPGYEMGTESGAENTTENDNIKNGSGQNQSEKLKDNSGVRTTHGSKKKPIFKNVRKNIDKNLQAYNYLIIIAFLSMLYFIIKFLRRKFILKNAVNSESLIPLYVFILKRLKTIGLVKKSYETDREFAARIKSIINIEMLVAALYKEIYGNEKSDIDRNSIIIIVEKIVKDRSNVFKYYIFF